MDVSSDYEDLFSILNTFKIKYLVVGAHAVIYYSEPRYTKDIDIWISPDFNDANQIYRALKEFGAPLRNINPDDFLDKKMIYQIGVAPVRVDIMMDVPRVSFDQAWKNRQKTRYGKVPISIIGFHELIQAKKYAARPQDKLDLIKLTKKRKTSR